MSKCWYCNNELTSGDSPKHFGICNKCYDKMFKSGDTIIRSLTNKISDLEAKLAESEKDKQFYFFENGEKGLKIRELKQQLAEKDKAIENWQTIYESVVQTCHNDKEEIERLNKRLETQENIITNLVEDNRASQEWYRKQLEEKDKEIEYQESMKILAVENQNKNAIEQLEQIINLFEPYENEEKDTILCANNGISFLEYIDNQINELKGEK